MQPEDVFRRLYDDTTRALAAWADGLGDVADVAVEPAREFWRLALLPHAANACPVEIILHRNQTYDLVVGPEGYEALPLAEAPGDFRTLLEGVVAGQVVTRHFRSTVTGLDSRTETRVELADGGSWMAGRDQRGGPASDVIISQTHYVPYRRR